MSCSQVFSVNKTFFNMLSYSSFFVNLHDDTLQHLLVIHQHWFHLKYLQLFPLNFDGKRYLKWQQFQYYFFVHTALVVSYDHFQELKSVCWILAFFLSFSFSTWRFLMITSFKFSIPLSKPSNMEVTFFSRLTTKVAVPDTSEVLAFVSNGVSTIASVEVLTYLGCFPQLVQGNLASYCNYVTTLYFLQIKNSENISN